MFCLTCGNVLTGRQQESCSKRCRIRLDTAKRRDSGRLRKDNMTAEGYAAKLRRGREHGKTHRADGKGRITWRCVTCNNSFTSRSDNKAGYWCSNTCLAKWERLHRHYWSKGIEPSDSQTIATIPKLRPKHQTTFIRGRKWVAGYCAACGAQFVSHYRDKTCSNRCRRKLLTHYGQWISPLTRLAIYERDQWVCHLCGELVPQDLDYSYTEYQPLYPSLDHLVPRSHGGGHDPSNLNLAHMGCNALRGNTVMHDFLAQR